MFNFDFELPAISEETAGWFDYFMRLKSLACTMFKWSGLPSSVNARYLEEQLFSKGYACFFNHPTLGYLGLSCSASGENVYGDPTTFLPYAPGYQFDMLNTDNCVFIRNTPDCYPTVLTTVRYAKAMFDIDGTRDVNLAAQKTPVLIITNEKQRRTMEKVYSKYKGNQPVIFAVNDVLDPKSIQCLKTDAPFIAGQVQDMKLSIYNEYVTFLGLGKPDEKAERLVSGEIDVATKEASALANIMLTPRKEAAEKINTMFGLDVNVELRSDLEFSVPNYNRNNTAVTYNFTTAGRGGE